MLSKFFVMSQLFLADCSGNGVAVALVDCGSRCACSARWTGTCCERRRPWRNWGDPHLETLDGKLFSHRNSSQVTLCDIN